MSAASSISTVQERWLAWVLRRQRVETVEFRVQHRRIYILPTGYGVLYAALIVVMLLCSLNYGISLGFLLTFGLAGLGANAMWRTHRNLHRLRLEKGQASPVFAGSTAEFLIPVGNPSSYSHHALHLEHRKWHSTALDVAAQSQASFRLSIPAPRRGVLRPGRFVLYTRFPLGLFRAWSWVEFDMSVSVYPSPRLHPLITLDTAEPEHGSGGLVNAQPEDFSGLRNYQAGDPPRHIAWKAMARQEKLLTKQFSGETGKELWLEWSALSMFETEDRLSILCHWVQEAESAGLPYGLRLPDTTIAPGYGQLHSRSCLEALARFPTASA